MGRGQPGGSRATTHLATGAAGRGVQMSDVQSAHFCGASPPGQRQEAGAAGANEARALENLRKSSTRIAAGVRGRPILADEEDARGPIVGLAFLKGS